MINSVYTVNINSCIFCIFFFSLSVCYRSAVNKDLYIRLHVFLANLQVLQISASRLLTRYRQQYLQHVNKLMYNYIYIYIYIYIYYLCYNVYADCKADQSRFSTVQSIAGRCINDTKDYPMLKKTELLSSIGSLITII